MAAAEQTLDFAPNYCHVIELDVTPYEAKPTWKNALVGITECAPASDETVDEDDYYDNFGFDDTNVSKVKPALALTGFRRYGDPVQDFVQSKALTTGKDRKTNYRWTHPDGTYMQGKCTLVDLVPGSGMGEASAKGDLSYTINLDTVDTLEIGTSILAPTEITATDVTATVGAATPVNAEVGPEEANQKCHYAIEDVSIATVDADGNVTGVVAGETTLTIKAASKPSIVKQVRVTVSAE
jgi:hypothetical protein